MTFNIYMTFVDKPADAVLSNFGVPSVPSSSNLNGLSNNNNEFKLETDVKPVLKSNICDKCAKTIGVYDSNTSSTISSSIMSSHSSDQTSLASDYTTDSGHSYRTDSSFSTDSELHYSTSSANSRQRRRHNKNRKYGK